MSMHLPVRCSPASLRREQALASFGGRPFTASDGLAAGLTRDDLRSAAVTRVARGVFVAGEQVVSHGLRVAGLSLILPAGAHFAGPTAAVLLGLSVGETERIHVSVPHGVECRVSEVIVHRHARVVRTRAAWVKDAHMSVPVSVDEQLVQELAAGSTLVETVVVADELLDRSRDPSGLREMWRAGAGPHQTFVRRVESLARAGSESAMETRLRLLLVLGGLPEPTVQHPVLLEGRPRRFDLAYVPSLIAVEYDGAHHFRSEEQKHADAVRRDAAALAHWLVISVVPHGIFRDPAGTLRRVASACAARGMGFRPSHEWRQHFPQRE